MSFVLRFCKPKTDKKSIGSLFSQWPQKVLSKSAQKNTNLRVGIAMNN